MNNQNIFVDDEREWINPSKCLVDKALERWSTTKMRADNTSVVIIMLDPPGPPKRVVLRANSMLIDNTNTDCTTAMESTSIDDIQQAAADTDGQESSKNFTMYDHATKKVIDLDVIANGECVAMSSTRSNNNPMGYDPNQYKPLDYNAPSTSGLSYLNSFAESYNSLLNSNYDVDHSYTTTSSLSPACSYQPPPTSLYNEPQSQLPSLCDDATYSLTKLATRTEQEEEGYVAVTACNATLFDDDETRACIFGTTYPSMDIDENQYDSITSSHLSAACEVYDNLDCSAQANISRDLLLPLPPSSSPMVCDDNVIVCAANVASTALTAAAAAPHCDNLLHSLAMPQVDDAVNVGDPQPDQSVPMVVQIPAAECDSVSDSSATASKSIDQTIQIHEISSSSKDNDGKSVSKTTTVQCESKENAEDCNGNVSAMSSRVTRSKQKNVTSTGASKVEKTRMTMIQRRHHHTNVVQNENIVLARTTRHRSQTEAVAAVVVEISPSDNHSTSSSRPNIDNSQRTLRSKNVINKNVITVNNKKLSNVNPVILAAKTKLKTVGHVVTNTSKRSAKVQAMVATITTTDQIVPTTRWLREKSKPDTSGQQQQQQSTINSTKQKPSTSTVLSRQPNSSTAIKVSALKRTVWGTTTEPSSVGKSNRIKSQQAKRK